MGKGTLTHLRVEVLITWDLQNNTKMLSVLLRSFYGFTIDENIIQVDKHKLAYHAPEHIIPNESSPPEM